MRERSRYLVSGAFAIACCVFVSLWGSLGVFFPAGDYPGPPCNGCDSAGPPLAFLVRGHVSKFFSTQPFMGSVSLLLRAPAFAVVTLLKDDVGVQYRVGTLVCFLAAAALLLPAIALMLRRGQRLLIALIVIAAVFVGPATFAALRWGHPKELLGAALAIAAILAVIRWYLDTGGGRKRLIAITKRRFKQAGTVRIRLVLDRRARRMLSHLHHARMTAEASFTVPDAQPVRAAISFTIKRHLRP